MDPIIMPQQTVSGVSGGGDLSLYQYFTASPLFAGFKDFEGADRKLFISEYVTMPASLKNFFADTSTASNITTLGLSYQLDDSQVSKIAETVRELIIGKIFIKDFPTTISSKLGIDDVKAGEIVNKIVAQSFGPIIEDVKRIQRSKFPDKVMAMQKESQPAGLTQPTARPDMPQQARPPIPTQEIKNNTPPTQTNLSQEVQSVRPPASPLVPRPVATPIPPPQPSPTQQATTRPVVPVAPPQQVKPPIAPAQPLPRPQFKMPNLDSLNSSVKQAPLPEKQSMPTSTSVAKPMAPTTQPVKPESAKKSLEEELEKVANIIDLRAKSEEQ